MISTQRVPLLQRAIGRPEGVLIATFAALILIGTALLTLPVSHATDRVGVLEALFTATSAVCVTGLIVVDTGRDFSLFGQTVILALIQLGGLGIMTFGALVLQVVGKKISFRSQLALQDVFFQRRAAMAFRRSLAWIVLLTLSVEAIGAALLYLSLPDAIPRSRAIFFSVFHAVSAFCNAGFSTRSDSLESVRGNLPLMTVFSGLIIAGGLGYVVLFEVFRRPFNRLLGRPNPLSWSLHTRVVVLTSAALLVLGAVGLAAFGIVSFEQGGLSVIGGAVFQSITARTAGFNTIDMSGMPLPTLLWLVALMFVGGSPGSCAGGIKTTSLAIWLARLRSRLLRLDDVQLGRRRIPVDLVRRTGLLIGMAGLFNCVGFMVLALTESRAPGGPGLAEIVFEQISAFATVGLSTGLTPGLSTLGKLWIIVTMFVGRLGPLTVALIVTEYRSTTARKPEERLMIG